MIGIGRNLPIPGPLRKADGAPAAHLGRRPGTHPRPGRTGRRLPRTWHPYPRSSLLSQCHSTPSCHASPTHSPKWARSRALQCLGVDGPGDVVEPPVARVEVPAVGVDPLPAVLLSQGWRRVGGRESRLRGTVFRTALGGVLSRVPAGQPSPASPPPPPRPGPLGVEPAPGVGEHHRLLVPVQEHLPSPLMHLSVVESAQEQAIVHGGRPPIRPVANVVHMREPKPAFRPPASPVPELQRPAKGRRHRPALPAQIQHLAPRSPDHRHQTRVAGQPSSALRRQPGAVLQVGTPRLPLLP